MAIDMSRSTFNDIPSNVKNSIRYSTKAINFAILSDHISQESRSNNKLFHVDILHVFYNFIWSHTIQEIMTSVKCISDR